MTIARPQCTPDIEFCIVDFLITLTAPELTILRGVIASTATLGTVVGDLLQVQLDELNVVKTVYSAALAPLQATQNTLLGSLGILPLSRIPDCVGLGSLIANLRDLIKQFSPRVGAVEDFINGIDQTIDNLQKQVQDLLDFLQYMQSVISCIDQVILYANQVATQP